MATTGTPRALGFGYDRAVSGYHFVLITERDGGAVRIEERFGEEGDASGHAAAPVVKAVVDGYRWSKVSESVRHEFNTRLGADGTRVGRWRAGETVLAPHLGKELTLLVWVIEESDPSLVPNMLTNWLGLAPEERWWLYTTVNATSGHPEYGRDRGWRKAIKIALAENPAMAATPGGWLSRSEVDQPQAPPRGRRKAGRTGSDPGQLPLLDQDSNQLSLQIGSEAGEASR